MALYSSSWWWRRRRKKFKTVKRAYNVPFISFKPKFILLGFYLFDSAYLALPCFGQMFFKLWIKTIVTIEGETTFHWNRISFSCCYCVMCVFRFFFASWFAFNLCHRYFWTALKTLTIQKHQCIWNISMEIRAFPLIYFKTHWFFTISLFSRYIYISLLSIYLSLSFSFSRYFPSSLNSILYSTDSLAHSIFKYMRHRCCPQCTLSFASNTYNGTMGTDCVYKSSAEIISDASTDLSV